MPHRSRTPQKRTTVRAASLARCLFAALSRAVPGLAERLAERVFLTPPKTGPAGRPELAEGARRLAFPAAGRRLTGWHWGGGPKTALLVHGWGGHGLQLAAVGSALADRGWRAVAVDLPAHGGSSGRSTNLLELAAAVAAVARIIGDVEVVVAHSFGVAATLVAADRDGLHVPRLVAVSPATGLEALAARFGDLTGFAPRVVAGMRRRMAERLGFAWAELEGRALAPRLAAPALVVHDRADRQIPVAEAVELVELLPAAELELTEGLGHYALLRDTGVVERIVNFTTRPTAVATRPGSARRSS